MSVEEAVGFGNVDLYVERQPSVDSDGRDVKLQSLQVIATYRAMLTPTIERKVAYY